MQYGSLYTQIDRLANVVAIRFFKVTSVNAVVIRCLKVTTTIDAAAARYQLKSIKPEVRGPSD